MRLTEIVRQVRPGHQVEPSESHEAPLSRSISVSQLPGLLAGTICRVFPMARRCWPIPRRACAHRGR
jgi:hypothetical protein